MKRGVLIAIAVVMLAGLMVIPAHAAACTNDNFDSATTIADLDHGEECDTSAAGTESPAGEPGPTCAAGQGFGRTVWWKYTPTVATKSNVKVNTYFSSYNTLMALYRQDGSGFAGLVELACNNNVATNKNSRVTQALELGETYYVQVGGVLNAGGTLKFRMKPRLWNPGLTRGNVWYFNNGFDGGTDSQIAYGAPTDTKLAGNWGGHGVDTPWVRRGNTWIPNDWFDSWGATQFNFGQASDRPLLGDWNADEVLSPAVRRSNVWYLNNGRDGTHDIPAFGYGNPADFPLVGDWDGDGIWTPGVKRGSFWYLSNNFLGVQDVATFAYGSASDVPVVGDWDGDGKMTPGVVRGNVWYLSNAFDGAHEVSFAWGRSTDGKIVGDWNGFVE